MKGYGQNKSKYDERFEQIKASPEQVAKAIMKSPESTMMHTKLLLKESGRGESNPRGASVRNPAPEPIHPQLSSVISVCTKTRVGHCDKAELG